MIKQNKPSTIMEQEVSIIIDKKISVIKILDKKTITICILCIIIALIVECISMALLIKFI